MERDRAGRAPEDRIRPTAVIETDHARGILTSVLQATLSMGLPKVRSMDQQPQRHVGAVVQMPSLEPHPRPPELASAWIILN